MNKYGALKDTVEIVKEYARGGGTSIPTVLEQVYEMLKKLNQDAEKEE